MSEEVTIVWFRNDLRLADHPALRAAVGCGGLVLPVFIQEEDREDPWPPGAASRWWLHGSLTALSEELERRGSRLILRRGDSAKVLLDLAEEVRAKRICWNRRYEPAGAARDQRIETSCKGVGLEVNSFPGNLLFEPWEIQGAQGQPYQVFTAFWKCCVRQPPPGRPLPVPRQIPAPKAWPASLPLEDLELLPDIDWAGGLREAWTPGTVAAAKQLQRFLKSRIRKYAERRDRPDEDGVSRFSPYLHFGEISPRQVWHAVRRLLPRTKKTLSSSAEAYLRQLGWREFAHHLLHHFPRTPEQPLREAYTDFPWKKDARALKAWQQGQTGYPLVDAGMRQLWATGWMHNRVRMVVGSFLVKDLLISWTNGAQWFWDTLVDADLANNTLGWQWVAGCGADAAPFFRIFNPVAQGEKFDPRGDYVRRWVPELAELPAKVIHRPWQAPLEVLREAGVVLGKTYPEPIVSHAKARLEALKALSMIKGGKKEK